MTGQLSRHPFCSIQLLRAEHQQAWHDVRKCNPFTSNDGGDSAKRQCRHQRSLGSVPPGKKGRADSLLNTQPSSRGGVSKPYPRPVYRALAGGLKRYREPTVISLKLRKTPMCVTGGRAAQNSTRCNVRRPLAGALSDNGSRQGGEQQHGADAEQDDILEYELTGEVPGYRVSRQAPANDTWRRKEE